jgi:methyltransferase
LCEENVPHEAASSSAEYAVMALVHALLLACPLLELQRLGAGVSSAVTSAVAIAALALAQALRWWTISTLGVRWNARAVVAPSLGAVHDGPYRFLRHPNYLAVTLEFAALPFVAGTWRSGALLFVANAVLLARRMRQEERLLARVPGWREGFER